MFAALVPPLKEFGRFSFEAEAINILALTGLQAESV
jgi:hypothetical protein